MVSCQTISRVTSCIATAVQMEVQDVDQVFESATRYVYATGSIEETKVDGLVE